MALVLPDPNDPAVALPAAVALRRTAEQLENDAVESAIRQGWTWTAIAQTLGVSRQAVHKRHRKRIDDIRPRIKAPAKSKEKS